MPRKKTVKASEESAPDNGGEKVKSGLDALIVQGIWGLIYLAVGVLMLISMLFYSPSQHAGGGATHILGPYFGTALALGMFYLFGRVTAFAFPAAVCYIGAAKLTNRRLRLKLLLFLAALTFELCVMLAVGLMPALKEGGLSATANATGSNFIGLLTVSGLVPLFGGRVFGPYFITSLLMAITVVIGLRIRPQSAVAALSKWFAAIGVWIKRAFTEVKISIENSPDIREEVDSKNVGTNNIGTNNVDVNNVDTNNNDTRSLTSKKKSAKTTVQPAASTPPWESPEQSGGDDENIVVDTPDTDCDDERELTPEEAAKKRLEDELKQFRDMKKEGVKIMVVETPDVEVDDDAALAPLDGGESFGGSLDSEGTDGGEILYDENGERVYPEGGEFAVSDPPKPVKPYILPSPDILSDPPPVADMFNKEEIERTSALLEKTLMNFKVEGKVVSVSPGPVVTRYEIVLAPGIRVSKVTTLQDDLMMAAGAEAIRIQAPIPGKMAVGIELPNSKRQNVHFKHILMSNEFKKNFTLPVIIGSNISGIPYATDITKTPHLLVAGQTGSGKSVGINSLICTMLMTKKPDELRFIMVDPKVVELASYAGIPHLLSPIVNEPKEAVKALQWSVEEMERRYRLLAVAGARKIDDFNAKIEQGKLTDILPPEDNKPLPLIVIIIDELADLMMTAAKDVETLIARITQKARAAGMHMIIATQRPSVNVVTGLIKANLPSRIAFRTVSQIDSRTILDQGGSEKLLGMGDMLFLRNGATNVERFHGAFIPDDDVERIVAAIKEQDVEVESIGRFNDIIKDPEDEGGFGDDDGGSGGGKRDELFGKAAQVVVSMGLGSTSLLQRQMEIGFARAGRIMDQLERAGIVGPSKGSKAREVLVRPEELEDYL